MTSVSKADVQQLLDLTANTFEIIMTTTTTAVNNNNSSQQQKQQQHRDRHSTRLGFSDAPSGTKIIFPSFWCGNTTCTWSDAFRIPSISGILVVIRKSAAISKSWTHTVDRRQSIFLHTYTRTFLRILAKPRTRLALSLIPTNSSLNFRQD